MSQKKQHVHSSADVKNEQSLVTITKTEYGSLRATAELLQHRDVYDFTLKELDRYETETIPLEDELLE